MTAPKECACVCARLAPPTPCLACGQRHSTHASEAACLRANLAAIVKRETSAKRELRAIKDRFQDRIENDDE